MVRGEQLDIALPEALNLGAYFLDVNMEAGRGDKAAVLCKEGTYTFRDLSIFTNRIGNVMKILGVEPGNRVLLILGDSPAWIAAWLATMKIGAVGTHAYTYLESHEYEYLLQLIRPTLLVADRTTLPRVRAACRILEHPPLILVAGDEAPELRKGEIGLRGMTDTAGDSLAAAPTHRDDIAYWNFSSGTTGKPKGVPHTHRDGAVSYASFDHFLGYTEDDIVLRVPKLFFHYARDNGMLFALRKGASVVLSSERSTATSVFDLIRRYRPTVLLNVPSMMRAMVQTPSSQRSDLGCLRRNFSSGEPLPLLIHEEWKRTFGVEVIDRLGSAESGMGYLCNRPGAVVPGSSGKVTPLAEIKLVDRDGDEVPVGEPGVLMTRSDASGTHYMGDEEKSTTTFLDDRWVNTGDLFRQDEEGNFWFMGRADDLVKVSGIWLSPLEIEQGLQECPRVADAAVIGLENDDGLMTIKAFVVLRQDAPDSAETRQEIRQFCKARLGPHKFPRIVEVVNDLPKTGHGKIDRRLLRGHVVEKRCNPCC